MALAALAAAAEAVTEALGEATARTVLPHHQTLAEVRERQHGSSQKARERCIPVVAAARVAAAAAVEAEPLSRLGIQIWAAVAARQKAAAAAS